MTVTVNLGPWADAFTHPGNLVQDVASKVREDTDPFVPYRNGALTANVTFLTQGMTAQIVYGAVYAHYVFVGEAMGGHKPKHYTGTSLRYFTGRHSQAGKDWIGRASAANMTGWENFTLERLLHG